MEAHENLRMLSQHMHINAFHDVWLGSNTGGLLESLPHDMMHAFLHGVLMYVIEVIMSPLNPTDKFQLDAIVDDIVVPLRSSLRKIIPDAVSHMESPINSADERWNIWSSFCSGASCHIQIWIRYALQGFQKN